MQGDSQETVSDRSKSADREEPHLQVALLSKAKNTYPQKLFKIHKIDQTPEVVDQYVIDPELRGILLEDSLITPDKLDEDGVAIPGSEPSDNERLQEEWSKQQKKLIELEWIHQKARALQIKIQND